MQIPVTKHDQEVLDRMPPCGPPCNCGARYFYNESGRIDIFHRRPEQVKRAAFEAKTLTNRPLQIDWTNR